MTEVMDKKGTEPIIEEEVLEKTGPDQKHNERVFNYKVDTEEVKEVELGGLTFVAKFYKTTSGTGGIRVPLASNGLLFEKFLEYCSEVKDKRIDKEIQSDLMAFTTFGHLDGGLEFFPVMGFYVYPLARDPHVVFNEEKDAPTPYERLVAFVDYYKKKLGVKITPKKSSFDSLRNLVIDDI